MTETDEWPLAALNQYIVRVTGEEPKQFGSGFVIRSVADDGRLEVHVLTCEHVVKACEKTKLLVFGEDVEEVVCRDETVDMAVIRCATTNAVRTFRIAHAGTEPSDVEIQGFRNATATPLRAQVSKDTSDFSADGSFVQKKSILLDEKKEQHDVLPGYSGSAVVLREDNKSVVVVLDTRAVSQTAGRYSIASGFPLWHLAKIWPEMPDEIGEQLYPNGIWAKLKQVVPVMESQNWPSFEYDRVFARLFDDFECEPNLWSAAAALLQWDNASDRFDKLIRKLAEEVPSLLDDEPQQDVENAAATVEQTYRRLIVHITEVPVSSRDETPGRHFQIDIHKVEITGESQCCPGSVHCVVTSQSDIQTVWARTLDRVPLKSIRTELQESIEDILGIFNDQTDLLQFHAPEDILPFLICEEPLDQISYSGRKRLFVDYQVMFSGAKRSDTQKLSKTKLKTAELNECWTGEFKKAPSEADDLDFRQYAEQNDIVGAICNSQNLGSGLDSRLPILIVPHDDRDYELENLPQTCCLRTLPEDLHRNYQRVALVMDTPNQEIHFDPPEEDIF